MQKIITYGLVAILLFSCKKADWITPIPIGTRFNYNIGSNSLGSLIKPDGSIPTNPFRVDSVAVAAYKGYNGYWCTSANRLSYVIDPIVIRDNEIK